MKVLDIRWIGMLVHDYDATRNFLENTMGLEKDWEKKEVEITMYRLPSGQEIEVYAPSNRSRNKKFQSFNGPVFGFVVEDIHQARQELIAKGAEFVDQIEGLADGSVQWTHFWGPDGQFYALHQYDES